MITTKTTKEVTNGRICQQDTTMTDEELNKILLIQGINKFTYRTYCFRRSLHPNDAQSLAIFIRNTK